MSAQWRAMFAVAAVLALVVAGCGGGDKDNPALGASGDGDGTPASKTETTSARPALFAQYSRRRDRSSSFDPRRSNVLGLGKLASARRFSLRSAEVGGCPSSRVSVA